MYGCPAGFLVEATIITTWESIVNTSLFMKKYDVGDMNSTVSVCMSHSRQTDLIVSFLKSVRQIRKFCGSCRVVRRVDGCTCICTLLCMKTDLEAGWYFVLPSFQA